MLKDMLSFFEGTPAVRRAYWVRLGAPWPDAGLCLTADERQDIDAIADRLTWIWHWHRGAAAPLVLCFLTEPLERHVAAVSRPFYTAA